MRDIRIRSNAGSAEIAEVLKECQVALMKVQGLNEVQALSLTVEELGVIQSAGAVIEQHGTTSYQVSREM